jgi:hypothetical protein
MSITNLNFYRDLLATRGCFEGTNVDQLVVRRPALGTNLLICNTVNNTVNINGTLNVSGGISVSGLTTDGITEGSTNLYYTNARARAAISVNDSLANLGYSSSTGVISLVSSPTFNSMRLTTGASNGLYLRSDASGNASWNALPASVSSLTGTADQILVAGTSGSPQTGVITLTLPQSINTSSSPTFASLTATNSVFATTLFGRNTAVNANDTLYLGSSVANQQFFLDRPNTGGAVNIGYMTAKSSTFNPIFNVYNNTTDKTQCFSVYSAGTTNGQNSVFCGVNLGLSTTTPTQALEISGVNRQIYLNSSTSNFVRFNSQGSAAPTISGARSAGSKVILADLFSSGTSSDHSIGVDTGTVWYNTALNTHQHKWFLGASQMMALSTTGLSVGSSVITEMFSCGSANQFRVNSSGQVVAGSWNAGIIGLQFGGVGVSLVGTGSTGAVLRQNSLGATITVSQLAASDLSNGVSGSGSVVLSQSPTITGNLSVNGNLLITGETINSIANDVRFGDRYLFVNATYTTNTGLETGMIFNFLPTNTTSALASSFVAGVNGVSNPRVNTVASGLFAAGDLVLITDSTSNDGIFEVESNVGTLLVVRGVGLTAPTFSFTSTQFVAEASTGNVRRIGATVLRCDTTGNLGVASGNTTTGMSFANLLRSGGALGTPSSGNLSSCTNYPASALTGSINLATQVSGLLGVANAGLGVSLAGTGGASQVLRQSTLGGAVSVSQLSAADLSNGTSGSGNVVLATSPVLSSPALGTPTSGNLSSCTNYPASALSGSISLTSQVSGILPIANAGLGVSLAGTGSAGAVLRQNSLGANITVSQLSATDLSNGVSGSGSVVLANSPTLITPALGVVSSGNLAACTNYPASALSGSVSLTSQVSGVLPLSNGGSNANLTAISGGIVYSDSTRFAITGAGSAGQILTSNGAGAPTWSNLSGIGVSSISANAGQIDVNSSTGAVNLAIPTLFSPDSLFKQNPTEYGFDGLGNSEFYNQFNPNIRSVYSLGSPPMVALNQLGGTIGLGDSQFRNLVSTVNIRAPTLASSVSASITKYVQLYVNEPPTTANGITVSNRYAAFLLGRVGINTDNPLRMLDVNVSDGTPQLRLTSNFGPAYVDLQGSGSSDLIISSNSSGGAASLTVHGNRNIVPGSAALATNATTGFVYTQTCNGPPTGVPTTYTGRSATVFDTRSNVQYVHNGSWMPILPTGVVLPFASQAAAPNGFLLCEGQAVSRATFAGLFAVIGIIHGQGDGSTTFNVPDYRGRFLRGRANGSANDPDRASRTAMNTGGSTGDSVGSVQTDQFRSHQHYGRRWDRWGGGNMLEHNGNSWGWNSDIGFVDAAGGNETRPINAYVAYIIKT